MTVRTTYDPELTKKIVKTIPIFTSFTDQELSSLLERANVYKCSKGETIFLDDDQKQLMYIILKGRVKVVEITYDGMERVMAFRQRLFRRDGAPRWQDRFRHHHRCGAVQDASDNKKPV
jgi:CRP-like cAMP-binding protein